MPPRAGGEARSGDGRWDGRDGQHGVEFELLAGLGIRIQTSRMGDRLLVEENPLIRMFFWETLTEAGLEVIAASGPGEALAFPETMQAPAVLVTDAQLGTGMDGLGLAAVAR